MTDNSKFKKAVRARMAQTGEKYTAARRSLIQRQDEQETYDALAALAAAELAEQDAEPAAYVGDFYDHTPYGDFGGAVQYTGQDNEPGVLAGKDVDWADDDQRRRVITAIMEHHLGRPPSRDAVEGFLEEFRDTLEEGFPFEVAASDVAHMAY